MDADQSWCLLETIFWQASGLLLFQRPARDRKRRAPDPRILASSILRSTARDRVAEVGAIQKAAIGFPGGTVSASVRRERIHLCGLLLSNPLQASVRLPAHRFRCNLRHEALADE